MVKWFFSLLIGIGNLFSSFFFLFSEFVNLFRQIDYCRFIFITMEFLGLVDRLIDSRFT